MKLVSIITPTLNSSKYLEDCVNSVLNQDYPLVEHIFMDGGSTDGTVEKLVGYQSLYPRRIRFIPRHDSGSSDAWVNGMGIANGDILGEIGSDDSLVPGAIKEVVSFFDNNPDAKFVFGGCNYIDENGLVMKQAVTRDFDLKEAINDMCSIPTPSAFFRPEVIKKVDPAIMRRKNSEIEFWIMVGKEFKIWRIEPILSNFRVYKDKKQAKDYLYNFAKTNYEMGRRHGAGRFSPNARRYYLAVATRPFQRIVDPVFNHMSTGDVGKSNLLIKATKPFHPMIRWAYRSIVGGG